MVYGAVYGSLDMVKIQRLHDVVKGTTADCLDCRLDCLAPAN